MGWLQRAAMWGCAVVVLATVTNCGTAATVTVATATPTPDVVRGSVAAPTPLVDTGPLTLHLFDVDPSAPRGSVLPVLAETRPHASCLVVLRMGESVVLPSNIVGDSNSGDTGTCSFAWYIPADAETGLYNLSVIARNQTDLKEWKVFVQVVP